MSDKITKEVAQSEFDQWFEARKLPKTRREGDAEAMANEFVCAIEEGYIEINEDLSIDLALREPLTEKINLSMLHFASRITAGVLQRCMSGIKSDDSQGRQIATIAALTGEVAGNIRALGTIDYSIAAVITGFH